jgi:hypothetical protein
MERKIFASIMQLGKRRFASDLGSVPSAPYTDLTLELCLIFEKTSTTRKHCRAVVAEIFFEKHTGQTGNINLNISEENE